MPLVRRDLRAGQVGSHCQAQLVSERRWLIGGDEPQVCEAHHAQTLRPDSGSHETSRTREMRQKRMSRSHPPRFIAANNL